MEFKKPTRKWVIIYSVIAIIITFFVIFLYWGRVASNVQEKRMNDLLEEINDLYVANEYLEWQINELERQKENLHWSAELNNEKIDELWKEFRGLKWEDWEPGMLNESGDAQLMPELVSSTEHERFKELASDYGLDAGMIWEVENYYGIKEGVVLCITVAETSGGNRWAGWKNIGSVWSNDRGDRPTYALMESWLEAIGRTLNNRYLWNHKTLWCLSNAWNCKEGLTARYATSDWNRERSMVACLSSIYGNIDPSSFSIRR